MQKLLAKRKSKFTLRSLTRQFLKFDLHGSEISVNFEGDTRYRTYLGSVCTLATFLIVFIYINLR